MMDMNGVKPHVVLKVGSREFSCRRDLLSSNSPYFSAMFTSDFIEKDQDVIEIKGVESDAVAFLLESLEISGVVDVLKTHDILSVLQAASMFQFDSIQEKCVEIIISNRLTVQSCLQIVIAADELQILSLYQKARALALWEFSRVKKTNTFFELPVAILEDYLKDDGLHVTQGEFEVFDAALSWLQDEAEERSCFIDKILQCIRFKDIDVSDMRTMFFYPAIMENEEIVNILKCILDMKEGCAISAMQDGTTDVIFCPPEEISLLPDSRVSEISDSRSDCECCLQLRCCSYFSAPVRNNRFSERIFDTSVAKCLCCNHSSCFKSASAVFSPSSVTWDSLTVSSRHENGNSSIKKYCARTVAVAEKLLSAPSRSLPIVPCVVGHIAEPALNIKTNKRLSTISGKPYAIFFDNTKAELVPFLHLAKVDEGPVEPTGYKVVARGQDVFIVGGEYLLGHGNWNKSIWHYNLLRESWCYETSLLSPRRHMSVCCLGDQLFVIGGFGRHRVITGSVEKYDIETKAWTRCASLPCSLYGVASVAHMGRVFVFGPQVYFYRNELDSWEILPEPALPPNRVFNCAVSYKNAIYLTGEFSTEMVRFVPHMSSSSAEPEPAECVGNFQHRAVNICSVGDDIYSFSTDDDGNMFVERYNIPKKEFLIVWQSSSSNNSIGDFNAKCCIGCFPLIKY